MKYVCSLIALILGILSLTAGENCGSFRDTRGRSAVDFAPLPGYVDVCSQDFHLGDGFHAFERETNNELGRRCYAQSKTERR
jgi:hypothetical protein